MKEEKIKIMRDELIILFKDFLNNVDFKLTNKINDEIFIPIFIELNSNQILNDNYIDSLDYYL